MIKKQFHYMLSALALLTGMQSASVKLNAGPPVRRQGKTYRINRDALPRNGSQEMARRRRQIELGQLTEEQIIRN